MDSEYKQPISPSVRKVFDSFLSELSAKGILDAAAEARLKDVLLEKQKLDAESLSAALFGEVAKEHDPD